MCVGMARPFSPRGIFHSGECIRGGDKVLVPVGIMKMKTLLIFFLLVGLKCGDYETWIDQDVRVMMKVRAILE